MELFTINPSNNTRETLIEHFNTFIWTDRYSAYGDLTLVTEPSPLMKSRLVPGGFIGFDESDRAMIIQSALREEDSDGNDSLKIVGKSMESVFEDRVAKIALNTAAWNITGTPGFIVANMVNRICVLGTGVSVYDIIPGLTVSDLTGAATSSTIDVKEGSLYERIKEICDAFDLGFKIKVTPGSSALPFSIYKGTNRTGAGGLTFSEDLENLSQSSYLVSKEGYKTGAYVFSANGNRTVYATGFVGTTTGFTRRMLLVNAMDVIGAPGATLDAALDQRGRDALSEHKGINLFDGVANPNGIYRYNRDYFLGDTIDLLGDDKVRKTMRTTEHIWSADSEGLKSYPTFSVVGGV